MIASKATRASPSVGVLRSCLARQQPCRWLISSTGITTASSTVFATSLGPPAHVLLTEGRRYYSNDSKSASLTSNRINNSSVNQQGKCPFTGNEGKNRSHSSLAADDLLVDSLQPKLQEVPFMPIFGSFFSAVPVIGEFLSNYKGVPIAKLVGDECNAYEYYPEMRRKYGDFYEIRIPGHGKPPNGESIVLTDPHEMLKVLRQEGENPRGGVETLWPFHNWARSRGMGLAGSGIGDDNGFFGRGDTWRRLRTFLQTDLLSPQAARGYVAGVAEAATVASQAAPAYAARGDINKFFNYAAFDMFSMVFFGQASNVADPDTPTKPEDEEFCAAAVNSLALMVQQISDPKEGILHKMGRKTNTNERFEENMDIVYGIAKAKIDKFVERYDNDELSETEKASYLARAIERLRAEGCTVTTDEFKDICVLLLNASVDTTASFIAWLVVHLSVNPEVQEKLYEEVRNNLEEGNGVLTAEMLSRKRSPYLHATMRESHRMTPVHPTTMTKSNSGGPVTIHGVEFPKGSVFMFDQLSAGMDPLIVDEPETFRPERWLAEGLEANRGTPAEMLDHPFYRDPFSQGARKCPGSRVAINETLAILAQLVHDYKIEAPVGVETYRDVPYKLMTLLVPQVPQLKMTSRY